MEPISSGQPLVGSLILLKKFYNIRLLPLSIPFLGPLMNVLKEVYYFPSPLPLSFPSFSLLPPAFPSLSLFSLSFPLSSPAFPFSLILFLSSLFGPPPLPLLTSFPLPCLSFSSLPVSFPIGQFL